MIIAFSFLAWGFVKGREEVEKSGGFGNAMSNGSHDNPPSPLLALRSGQGQREYTLKRNLKACVVINTR